MNVKELITELLNYNMESEVYLVTNKFYIDEEGNGYNGYSFKIDKIDTFGSDVKLLFTDYRDSKNIEQKVKMRTMENEKTIKKLEEIKSEVVNIPMDIHKKDILNILERHILKFKWGETKV